MTRRAAGTAGVCLARLLTSRAAVPAAAHGLHPGYLQMREISADRFTVPAAGTTAVALTYLGLGVEHILLGVDHLLFVLGLRRLVTSRRPSRRSRSVIA